MLWLWPSRERAEIKNDFSTFWTLKHDFFHILDPKTWIFHILDPKTWIFHFLAPTGHLAQISVGRRPRPPLGIRAALAAGSWAL